MFGNPDAVAFIYTVGGLAFLLFLFAGFLVTLARVIYYVVYEPDQRPRLLTRDIICYGGLTISFGLISAVRLLPLEVRLQLTTGNVLWALITTIPAVVAVVTYFYYEVFVVKIRPPAVP